MQGKIEKDSRGRPEQKQEKNEEICHEGEGDGTASLKDLTGSFTYIGLNYSSD